jgi:hypothetical protein
VGQSFQCKRERAKARERGIMEGQGKKDAGPFYDQKPNLKINLMISKRMWKSEKSHVKRHK